MPSCHCSMLLGPDCGAVVAFRFGIACEVVGCCATALCHVRARHEWFGDVVGQNGVRSGEQGLRLGSRAAAETPEPCTQNESQYGEQDEPVSAETDARSVPV